MWRKQKTRQRNDTKAAEKFRLHQARQIVCNLIVREVNDTQKEREIRVFYKTDNTDGYKPITYIMRDEDEYQKLLSRAVSELKSFQKKYSTLKELEGVWEAINPLTA